MILLQWYGSDFISDLGGALSIFLGITLSMLFEILEFFIDLSINLCFYTSGKYSSKKAGQTKPTEKQ